MPSCTCSRHKGWLCVASVFAATAFALLLVTGLLLPGTEKGSTVTLISENMPEFVTALVGTGGGAVMTLFVFCRAAWFHDDSAAPAPSGKKNVRRNTKIGAIITWFSMAVSLGLIALLAIGFATNGLTQGMMTAILSLGIAACIPFAIYTVGWGVGKLGSWCCEKYGDHGPFINESKWYRRFEDLKKQFLVTEQEDLVKKVEESEDNGLTTWAQDAYGSTDQASVVTEHPRRHRTGTYSSLPKHGSGSFKQQASTSGARRVESMNSPLQQAGGVDRRLTWQSSLTDNSSRTSDVRRRLAAAEQAAKHE